ncbi:sirohydrochlorin chelatase, partial [Streptomyces sp. WAC08241]
MHHRTAPAHHRPAPATGHRPAALVAVGHGSRDPRARATLLRLLD